MDERSKKRRRWPWVLLALGMTLAGGPIAWKFRPFNATERALVGRWFVDSIQRLEGGTMEFRTDRTFLMDDVPAGSWSANEKGVWLCTPPPRWLSAKSIYVRVEYYITTRLFPMYCDMKWNGPDWVDIEGLEAPLARLPAAVPPLANR